MLLLLFTIGVGGWVGELWVAGRSSLGSVYCINRPPRLQDSVTVDSLVLKEPLRPHSSPLDNYQLS